MGNYTTNEFKSGLKVIIDNNPCVIVENEFVKPGKGQAFNRVKYRNLITQRLLEKTFKSGESVEAADVLENEVQYLYSDSEFLHFMHQETFEQYSADLNVAVDSVKWLKEQDVCSITIYNGSIISVVPQNFVFLEVTDTDPGLKGDTVSGGNKPATVETGAVVRVPLFINIGDILKIDTRTSEYVSRSSKDEK